MRCGICGKEFQVYDLAAHKRQDHPGAYKAQLEAMTFSRYPNLSYLLKVLEVLEHKAAWDKARAALDKAEAEAASVSCVLDKPEDRLWHAEDGTWWYNPNGPSCPALKSADMPEPLKQKLVVFDDLLAACEAALEHIAELEDAWLRGAISERDGLGGTRSNRNAELRRRLQAAIAKAKAVQA